ncbi:hypothetical protein SAMN05421505_14925 [Sinosporangium album]|uniref:Bacteriophage lambda head decoration protein D n=1 Tax=Sinosporangium album TaxID=504805 RepID=A0A1G8KC65_9ACTN|nr:hypothetical protein [Sinosporangium album]SDI40939.1 hypothetical protein SAMN05421505_14925 [Sinosporangium album]
MDLSMRTETWATDDQSWLGSAHGTDAGRSITLDTSTFTPGTHYPDGHFPSGLPLGRITATGKYGPYAGRSNEVQTVTITGGPTGGTYTLTLDGETTAAIAYNASAAAVQAALEALSNVEPGDVAVTGGPHPGTAVAVAFGGRFTGKNVPQMSAASGSLTGGAAPAIAVTTGTAGGSAVGDGREVLAGFLLTAVRAPANSAVDAAGVLLWHGAVIESKLPIAVDAAGKSDVAGRIAFF